MTPTWAIWSTGNIPQIGWDRGASFWFPLMGRPNRDDSLEDDEGFGALHPQFLMARTATAT